MNVRFACPVCEAPARVTLSAPLTPFPSPPEGEGKGARDWHCPSCDHQLHIEPPAPDSSRCAVCGNSELYKKKDFPHWLGMLILVGACVASVFTYAFYEKWLTWAILIGSAVFDGLLYLWVKDALVCYRCNAHCSGIAAGDAHQPFDLQIGERYRQERIRREQLIPPRGERGNG